MRVKTWASASVLALAALGAAESSPYTGLYVFGDSLSDVGNVSLLTGGAVPAFPYFGGRFSNGPIWIDDLATALGFGVARPSLAGGNDYAFGGAVTGASVPGPAPTVPTIAQQVAQFTLASGGHASPTGLYALWIGSNDVFSALGDVLAGTSSRSQATIDLSRAAQAEADAIKALAQVGAHSFLVPLVPDLGKTPNVTDVPGLGPLATALSTSYNASLAAALGDVANATGADVHFVDTFALIDDAVANPAAFGLVDATDRCYVGSLTGGGTVCATPSTNLFWDGQHPTATSHSLIAAAALQAVPEPSPLTLLPIAVIAMFLGRRQRRR